MKQITKPNGTTHTTYCSDFLDVSGVKADLILTDLPYNIGSKL